MSGYGALFENEDGRMLITEGAKSYFENSQRPQIIRDRTYYDNLDSTGNKYWRKVRGSARVTHRRRSIRVRVRLPDGCEDRPILAMRSHTTSTNQSYIIANRCSGYTNNIHDLEDLAGDFFNSVKNAILNPGETISDVFDAAGNFTGHVMDEFGNAIESVVDAVDDAVTGIGDTIADVGGW